MQTFFSFPKLFLLLVFVWAQCFFSFSSLPFALPDAYAESETVFAPEMLELSGARTVSDSGEISGLEEVSDFPAEKSPYGVCAHLAAGQEHEAMPANLERMRAAGIRWVRMDFSWWNVENPKGVWHFETLDRVLDECEKVGIQVLPILNHQTSWGNPIHENLENWTEYVRQLVLHFQDRLRFWEVLNEPNLSKTNTPENYTKILKETYRTIKEIDPDLTVLYAGVAHVPLEYIEKTFQDGAGAYFDVLNVHPYRGALASVSAMDQFISEIQTLKELMRKYGIEKPIWITEMGWSTVPALNVRLKQILAAGLKTLFPDGIPGKAAVIADPKFAPTFSMNEFKWLELLPTGTRIQSILLSELQTLDAEKVPVLILPPSEHFPLAFFDEIYGYVQRGGTLVLSGGAPLAYRLTQDEKGVWRAKMEGGIPGECSKKLRLCWGASWTRKGTPSKAALRPAGGMETFFTDFEPGECGRFLYADHLLPGDEMVPILLAEKDDFSAPAACIYKFRNGMKGNLIVSVIWGEGMAGNRASEEEQAVLLPQAILTALAGGIERFFWYEFQAAGKSGSDREAFFGIVDHELNPKPAWKAYKTLTEVCPPGSKFLGKEPFQVLEGGKMVSISWKRPDGKLGRAVWSPGFSLELDTVPDFDAEQVGMEIQKDSSSDGKAGQRKRRRKVLYAVNYLGERVDWKEKIEISPRILYFIEEEPR